MKRIETLQTLPKVADSWTFLYVEHGKIERHDNAVALIDKDRTVSIPVAQLSCLLTGPGTSITHGAINMIAETGCSLIWCGESAVRVYASGGGETRFSRNLELQATAWANPETRLTVARRMYALRYGEDADVMDMTLEQLRGREGVRVRQSYARASVEYGVNWYGRSYDPTDWNAGDPLNKALNVANMCLYGICHAAIVAIGMSTGLGFIHTGHLLSFVWDIADLYKADISIPIAFRCVKAGDTKLDTRVRRACRDAFREQRILTRIVPDIHRLLEIPVDRVRHLDATIDDVGVSALWDDKNRQVSGGVNYAPPPEPTDE
jgi:CRISPR-associated protein Cas1